MRKLSLGLLITLFVVGMTSVTPALAVVDDGTGCGCIRPCHITKQFWEQR